MRRHLLLIILAYGLLSLISTHALAQTADPLAEAKRLDRKCVELHREGKYDEAIEACQCALSIREKVLGDKHSLADLLNYEAALFRDRGYYARAEEISRRAVAARKKSDSDDDINIIITLSNLSVLYEAKEDYPRAIELLTRAQEMLERFMHSILVASSEKLIQDILDIMGGTNQSVSLHAHSTPSNAQAARLALTAILRRKGRALDAMTGQIAALRRRSTPDDVKLFDALAAAQTQLTNLQLSTDTRLSPAEKRTRIKELEFEIGSLQHKIGAPTVMSRVSIPPVTLDAMRAAIPADAALVEIFVYKPHNPKAKSNDEKYGAARYVAYVLKPTDDTPQSVDLGEVAQVDADLKLWREALLDPDRADVRALGRRVDERVMRPVRRLLGTTRRVFISPDGALNLIPFAALVDENNKYLVETYALDYLTSGRDLLRLKVSSANRPGAVIFANPTYNLTGRAVAACQRRNRGRGLLLDTEDADAANRNDAAASEKDAAATRGLASRGIDFTQVCYPPLVGTAQEAARINNLLPGATVLTDKRATEAALKALNAPPILHIATHGFFLPDQPQTLSANTAPGANTTGNENPLLRSGLIMAGANQKASGTGEDGVLTAAEAAGLNLWGTKLVVLSACETGLGDVVNGEGVYGLRRALVLAGSETQVMSLWQVDDAATRDLMSDYYMRLQRNEGRTEAMRQAQLGMLRGETHARTNGTRARTQTAATSARHAHPYYWAAFISSGDWRSMNGKEQ